MKKIIDLNGSKQWIIVRGNEDAPLILYLHGGPGITNAIYLNEPFFIELEKTHQVIYCEQQGAGTSFSFTTPKQAFQPQQMVEDIVVLTEILLTTYKKDQLTLLGFSYGAFLGVQAVHAKPALYNQFIAIGMPVNAKKGNRVAYAYLETFAYQTNNASLLNKLAKIGEPPYQNMRHQYRFRLLLDQYAGFRYGRRTYLFRDFLFPLFKADVYNPIDKVKWLLGVIRSLSRIKIHDIDLYAKDIALKVPSLFISGQQDYIAPIQMVEEFLGSIETTRPEIVVISKVAHDVHIEKGELVLRAIQLFQEKNNQNNDKKTAFSYNSKNNQKGVKP